MDGQPFEDLLVRFEAARQDDPGTPRLRDFQESSPDEAQ